MSSSRQYQCEDLVAAAGRVAALPATYGSRRCLYNARAIISGLKVANQAQGLRMKLRAAQSEEV